MHCAKKKKWLPAGEIHVSYKIKKTHTHSEREERNTPIQS